jgi:hypothetical protein
MSDATKPAEPAPQQVIAPAPHPKRTEAPTRIFLIPFPKIIFLYPTFLTALVAAIWMSFLGPLENVTSNAPATLSTIFLVVLAINLVILAFDFPRTTSLTVFFILVALGLGLALLFVKKPDLMPYLAHILSQFRPEANATFYWAFCVIVGVITAAAWVQARFDCWEARPNELLHHHGIWGNLERFSAPGLRIDKEINDVFEYMLLRSGRLILHLSNERRAIILDNVPFIQKKEEALTRMLGALQVEVRSEDEPNHD